MISDCFWDVIVNLPIERIGWHNLFDGNNGAVLYYLYQGKPSWYLSTVNLSLLGAATILGP